MLFKGGARTEKLNTIDFSITAFGSVETSSIR
jgi:hypothetical protein